MRPPSKRVPLSIRNAHGPIIYANETNRKVHPSDILRVEMAHPGPALLHSFREAHVACNEHTRNRAQDAASARDAQDRADAGELLRAVRRGGRCHRCRRDAGAGTGAAGSEWDERLFQTLREWRRVQCQAESIPAFAVATDRSLQDIATLKPTTIAELKLCHGIGPHKAEKYGEAVVGIVKRQMGR